MLGRELDMPSVAAVTELASEGLRERAGRRVMRVAKPFVTSSSALAAAYAREIEFSPVLS